MATSSSAIFTGSSQFAADFQNSIKRTVALASLPITQLKSDVAKLDTQTAALGGMGTRFAALQTAVEGITQAMSGSSFQTDISNSAAVSVTLGDGAMEGAYSLEVQKTGAFAMSMTASSWDAGPAGSQHTYQLWVGDRANAANRIDITPADNSAATLAAAINAKASDKVRATVVNVGSSSTPDYRISLQSTTLGAVPVALLDESNTLQTQGTPGDASTRAVSVSTDTWLNRTNPSGQKHTYQLWIGDKNDPANKIEITPDDNSAASVAAAIMANPTASAKVTATAVNLGTVGAPDYRIRLEAVAVGALPLDLVDATLQDQKIEGELAQYIVNNSGKVVTSSSRQVSISDGLTVNLLAADLGTPVNITVTRSTSKLSDAISAFADAYNKVVDELDLQRGMSQGALGGQSIVTDLKQALGALGTYTASGAASGGLESVGLELETDGHLTFNQFKLIGTDFSNSSSITNFFGSATSGGFIKLATDTVATVADSTSGLIKTAETNIQNQIDSTNTRISDKQEQVDRLNDRLLEQMSAADAAIASMEQRYSYLSSMFSAMQTADQQYK